jgi:hypothetical protein
VVSVSLLVFEATAAKQVTGKEDDIGGVHSTTIDNLEWDFFSHHPVCEIHHRLISNK